MATNERNMIWNYPLLTTSENKQGKKTFTPKEFSFETIGMDFSVKGGLRPFPGLTNVHTFTTLSSETRHGDGSEIIDVFPVSFRIGTEYFGYGFVYRAKQDTGNSGDATKGDIFIDYYIKGEGWTYGTNLFAAPAGTASDPMDVVVFGRYVYIFVRGQEPILFYVKYAAVVAATCSLTIQDYTEATLGVSAVGKIQVVDTTLGEGGGTSGAVVVGDIITLPAADGTTITCTIHTDTTTSSPTDGNVTAAIVLGDDITMATNIATAVNYNSKFSAVAAVDGPAYVTFTQLQVGAIGNTTIALTLGTAGVITIIDQFADGAGDYFTMTSTVGTVQTVFPISGTGTNLSGAGAFGTFKVETSDNATATHFAACVNGSSRYTASAHNAQTTITQVTGGFAGNTVTTLSQTNADFATKSNFSQGTGTYGAPYLAVTETDTGPGVQIDIISPNSEDSVTVETLGDPTDVSHAQVFTDNEVGTHWDATPEDMDDVADLKAGNYAVAYVLTDPDTGRKTSLSKLAQIKQEDLMTKSTGRITAVAYDPGGLNGRTITIKDYFNEDTGLDEYVIFTFDSSETTALKTSTDGTAYRIGISGAGDVETAAVRIYDAIQLAYTNNDLDIIPSDPGAVDPAVAYVDLTHKKATTDGNGEITEASADQITVTGMSGAANFDPGNVGIEIVYDSGKFSRARIYRSVRVQDAGGSYAASIVQLDKIITLADYLTTSQAGLTGDYKRAIYYFRLTDLALIYQDPYIDRSVFDENMPKCGAAIEFDGILLASDILGSGSAGAAGEEGSFDQYRGLGEFRWSSMAETSPELFPPENYHIPSKIANQVTRFVRSGGVVLGFANNVIMHVSREFTGISSYMKVLPIHEGFGIVNRKAIQSIGPFTYYVNDKGVKTIDAQARLDSLHALDGIIEDWNSDFSSLSMAYDSQGSVLFIMNKAKKETALMWMNTASVSELHDMPFDLVTTGQWPSTLTDADSDLTERAFFLQNQPDFTDTNSALSPKLWVMDTKRENLIAGSSSSDFNGLQRITLLDGAGDTRFRVASYNDSTHKITIDIDIHGHQAIPTLVSNAANWVGAYVYIIGVADSDDESLIGAKAQIKEITQVGAAVDTIEVINWSTSPLFSLSAGDRIGISPVYMKWSGSLLGYNDPLDPQNPAPTGLHIGRTIDSIGSYFSSVSGAAFTDSVDTKDCFYKGLVFEGDSETSSSSSIPVDLSGDYIRSIVEGESTYWAGFETHGVRGVAVSPGIEVFCPDLDFRLLSVIIEGKIISTFRTERPS